VGSAPGKAGTDEVNVNAIDGSVIAVQHESPTFVQKEAAEDGKAAAKPRHLHQDENSRQ